MFKVLAVFLLLLAACSENTAVDDAGTRDAMTIDATALDATSADAALDASTDAAAEDATTDAGTPCEMLPRGQPLVIDRSRHFCFGSFVLPLGPDNAAVVIRTSNIRVECDDMIVANTAGFGTTEQPTIGFLLENVSNVELIGCGAARFRYGLVARNSTNLLIQRAHFDNNFHDPQAQWVQDSVQGGGIRFQGTTNSTVSESSFANNWNGIELRQSHRNSIRENLADHCSNTGATLVGADRNVIQGNDMSWGIRGDNLSFPNNWYGVDTKDSAGIIVDAESRFNVIAGNDFRYGGDGVFIRSVIGGCATDNIVQNNDTSFSPHNAIECWCDRNQFLDNIASDSDYGIWLGGTDEGVVRGNRVERNRNDGISIQIGEDRHSIIEGNTVSDNARTGILLSGREIQAWHPLTHVGPNLANSSHLLIQGNFFNRNGPCVPFNTCDVFIAASRSILLASNCTDNNATAVPTQAGEAEGVWTIGQCNALQDDRPPAAALQPVMGTTGSTITLDASASSDPEGRPLTYLWLVQRAGARFNPAVLPEAPLLGESDAVTAVTFPEPGLWQVSVTVHDGLRGSLASQTAAIAPSGVEIGRNAADWSYSCTTPGCVTGLIDDPNALIGASALRMDTDEAFPFAFFTDVTLDVSGFSSLGGFFRSENHNSFGWQGEFPTFVLHSSNGGRITYVPSANLLPTSSEEWIWVEAPLAGGAGWTRTVDRGNLADVTRVEIQTDTWDFGRYTVWVDALTFF